MFGLGKKKNSAPKRCQRRYIVDGHKARCTGKAVEGSKYCKYCKGGRNQW
jgi:hypothetical protein